MVFDSHSGSVLSQYTGQYATVSYSADDSVKAHLINFLSNIADRSYIASGSSGSSIHFLSDYPNQYNIQYPTCVVAIFGAKFSGYTGTFLYEDVAESGTSGSMVYGVTKDFDVRFDVWGRDDWERDVVAGLVERWLGWGFSPANNSLYDVGLRNITFRGEEILGFDQSDRIIKEVDHRDMTSKVFRRALYTTITADVAFVPPSGSEEYFTAVEEIIQRTYISSGSEASYDVLVSSGSISE